MKWYGIVAAVLFSGCALASSGSYEPTPSTSALQGYGLSSPRIAHAAVTTNNVITFYDWQAPGTANTNCSALGVQLANGVSGSVGCWMPIISFDVAGVVKSGLNPTPFTRSFVSTLSAVQANSSAYQNVQTYDAAGIVSWHFDPNATTVTCDPSLVQNICPGGSATNGSWIRVGPFDKVFSATSDVNCSSDANCSAWPTITVNSVAINGITGTSRYIWQGDRVSCTTDYIRPSGTSSGQFCRISGFVSPGVVYTPEQFGSSTLNTGSVDATSAITAACNAASSGGTVLIGKNGGTYQVGPLAAGVCSGVNVILHATLIPNANPASPAYVLTINGNNTNFQCDGIGGFDGQSSANQNWQIIHADAGPTSSTFIDGIRVSGCFFKNLGLGLTSSKIIYLVGVSNVTISGNKFTNNGRLTDFTGGDNIAINTAISKNVVIKDNISDGMGGIFMLNSCGLGTVVTGNKINNTTLFPTKSGFCSNAAVIPVSGATTTFFNTSGVSNYERLQFIVGRGFSILSAATAGRTYVRKVMKVVDNGTYLSVYGDETWSSSLNNAEVQTLPTAESYTSNTIIYSGNNCHDINGLYDVTITGEHTMFCGLLLVGGVTDPDDGGRHHGIWLGYDGGNGRYERGATITGNFDSFSAESGIVVSSGVTDATITGNTVVGANALAFSGSAAAGWPAGIYVAGGGTTGNNVTVGPNTVDSSSANYALYLNNLCGLNVSGGNYSALGGIRVDGACQGKISGSTVIASSTANGTAGITNYYDTTVGSPLHSSTLDIIGNTIILPGAFSGSNFGYGVINTDGASSVNVGDNTYRFTSTANVYGVNAPTPCQQLPGAGMDGSGAVRTWTISCSVAASGTVILGEWGATVGTTGGIVVDAILSDYTNNKGDIFRESFAGNTSFNAVGTPVVGATNPSGGTLVAAGMFSVVAGSAAGSSAAKFTNTTANTLHLTAKVTAFDRGP